jgi:hypothetical protein
VPTTPLRFPVQRNFARLALVTALVGSAGAIAYGLLFWLRDDELSGAAWAAGGLTAAALTVLMYAHFSLTHKAVSNSYRTHDALLDMVETMRRQAENTRTIADNSSLSEWAKRIVYREKDYEYLRDTIQAASVRQDWVAAERLVKELDEEFGLREEAIRLRDELARARKATTEEKVAAALRRFESLCGLQKWDQARRESQRLQTLFPDEPRITGLAAELDLRRQQYKRNLLKAYDDAVRNQDVDHAHRLLFELDHYLAPNEGAALKESARGVFKAKLQQMGAQFALAVEDRQFVKAIAIGERLTREFPNSRFAQEIASMMPALRQRATQEATARAS